MNPILIVKTANGYAVMEYSGDIPQANLHSMKVATDLSDMSWHQRGKTVQDILSAHFEPPQEAAKEAA